MNQQNAQNEPITLRLTRQEANAITRAAARDENDAEPLRWVQNRLLDHLIAIQIHKGLAAKNAINQA